MDYIFKISRTRIYISLNKDNNVVFHSPVRYSESRIQQMLLSKADWIEKMKKKISNAPKPFSLLQDSNLFIFEKPLTVCYTDTANINIQESNLNIPKKYQAKPLPKLLIYLKQNAKKFLAQRLFAIETNFSFAHHSFRLSNAKSYWGLYSHSTKQISLSWRLLFYKTDIIDYVILHELCHSVQQNHSPAFWDNVAKVCPDFKNRRLYLKKHNYMNLL